MHIRADHWEDAMTQAFGAYAHPLESTGLAHRIVWSVPQDAYAGGWEVDGEPAGRGMIDLAIQAGGTARRYGGCYLWPVIRGEANWRTPLADGPHDIAATHVLSPEEATAVEWNTDIESPGLGRPLVLQVTIRRDGMSSSTHTVHASRLCYVPGLPATGMQRTEYPGYDLSALTLYAAAIIGMDAAWDSTARLIERRAMPWLKLGMGRDTATTSVASEIGTRLRVVVEAMKAKGLLVLGMTDEVGWSGPSLSGTQESLSALATRLSAVEGIPATRIMGTAPGGLSTDDAAGTRAYDAVRQRARDALDPALVRWYEIQRGSSAPIVIEWESLTTPTPMEDAALSLSLAQRDSALIMAGVIGPDEARLRVADEMELLPVPSYDEPDAPEGG